ncbi:MAG: hypothetical protein K2L51_02805 [Clostridiales bacterium]|nr:hypothetical protein [Clostridiales bacterium]
MNQDEIYNLLLLLLLMSNERDGNDNNANNNRNISLRGSLNELIIASMLMSSCNNRDCVSLSTLANRCGLNNNPDTTF